MLRVRLVGALCAVVLLATACGVQRPVGALDTASGLPLVVATTSILGDVLEHLADGHFEVVTIMPPGADPHTFQPSPRDVNSLEQASAIVANGASFEEPLLDAVGAAESSGVPVFEAITAASPIGFEFEDAILEALRDRGHDDHADYAEGDGNDGDLENIDPHFFTDPARMADVAEGIIDFLAESVAVVDADALMNDGAAYVSQLRTLDQQVDDLMAAIPEPRRVMVTNHSVFGYFADRYDFEVIGTVVPVGSGSEGVSGRRLADLTALLKSEGVSVLFTDASSSDDLAKTLAAEVGNVAVVSLYTESLGDDGSEGATYVDMVRSNARRISEALA